MNIMCNDSVSHTINKAIPAGAGISVLELFLEKHFYELFSDKPSVLNAFNAFSSGIISIKFADLKGPYLRRKPTEYYRTFSCGTACLGNLIAASGENFNSNGVKISNSILE